MWDQLLAHAFRSTRRPRSLTHMESPSRSEPSLLAVVLSISHLITRSHSLALAAHSCISSPSFLFRSHVTSVCFCVFVCGLQIPRCSPLSPIQHFPCKPWPHITITCAAHSAATILHISIYPHPRSRVLFDSNRSSCLVVG